MKRIIMKRWSPIIVLAIGTLLLPATVRAAEIIVDLEDLTLAADSYWDGSDESGGFTSRGVSFNNNYDPTYGSWDGWAYSNMKDISTPGFLNQYSAYALPAGGGAGGSANFGAAFQGWATPTTITLPGNATVHSAMITNTTYAFLAVRDGDDGTPEPYVRKFGYLDANGDGDYDDQGDFDGNKPDWFKITVTGKDTGDQVTGTLDFYLADYRSDNNTVVYSRTEDQDYVLGEWTEADFSSLGAVHTLEFAWSSTDEDETWGINTPAYFALDNLELQTEPAALSWDGSDANWAGIVSDPPLEHTHWQGGHPLDLPAPITEVLVEHGTCAVPDGYATAEARTLDVLDTGTVNIASTGALTVAEEVAVGAEGALAVDGSLWASTVSVLSGGTLEGDGEIVGNTVVWGTISPGSGAGTYPGEGGSGPGQSFQTVGSGTAAVPEPSTLVILLAGLIGLLLWLRRRTGGG